MEVLDMRQDNYNTKNRSGKHLNFGERKIIEHLHNIQEKSNAEIAEELGRHRTTIMREIKKGEVEVYNPDYTIKKEYDAQRAQDVYEQNGTAKGPKIKIAKEHELSEYIEAQIKEEKKSPEVIAHEIKNNDKFEIKLHHNTIYDYIDKGILLVDREDLTYGEYEKSKTEKKKEKRSTRERKKGRRISDRPEVADEREELGHWEMDLLEGKKSKDDPNLLVLTERLSRNEIIERIPDKSQESVKEALDRIERRRGVKAFRNQFKSITTDNGTEFLDYEKIETSYTGSNISRTEHYYCDAYSPWQRGSNENVNKMIRRFIPKGEAIKDYSKKAIKKIQRWVNDYPRKMFNFKSSRERFKEELKAA